MNEILFMIGEQPVRTGEALIGLGALALVLLLVIAIVIARSGRRGAELAMAQAISADELEERLSEMSARRARPPVGLMRWATTAGARPRWRAPSTSGWIP
jgi:hypothetical protein